jgi:quercetin dioxygenase-like cupin family protein
MDIGYSSLPSIAEMIILERKRQYELDLTFRVHSLSAIIWAKEAGQMEKREPYASQEEFDRRVVHYADVPLVELVPGSNSHIVSSQNITVSFLTQRPNAYFPPHRHESEQIMIVIDGEQDEIVEGKLYHLKKGDVIILPSNIEHGGYIPEAGCKAIDIFSPPREDLVVKLREALSS